MSTPSHQDKVELKANLLTYPHHVAAPKIQPLDLSTFHRAAAHKVSRAFITRMEEIRRAAEALQADYDLNSEVYSSDYSFEPLVGECYHLYLRDSGQRFLSLVPPGSWSANHLYSVVLNSDLTWSKVE